MYEELRMGDIGEDVKILQEKLKILGFYSAVITGSFGLATEEGVKAFQKNYELEVNGIVDDATWQQLLEHTTPVVQPISVYPTLRFGDTGEFVIDLQMKLKALLYYLDSITGNFDLETENAVKRFQLTHNLTADGIVGSQTWNAMNSLYGNLKECAVDFENNNGDTGASEITYVVVPGDTLYSIAKRFDTTVDAIKVLNQLDSNVLQIGQVLKIPTLASDDYISYQVILGDTLYSIARRYNVSVDELKNFNQLTSDLLQVGQILKIPVKSNDTYFEYIVERGDTLYSIARRYNTSVDTIKSLNQLMSDNLMIGQVLKIPTDVGTNYIIYTVVLGDTLYSIARRYGTTVDMIREFNHLSSNLLTIGQQLKIPV